MSVSSRRRAHFHIFPRSSLFALQSWKSAKIGSKMEVQIGQNVAKTPSTIHVFFTPVFDAFFDQTWAPKWSPKCHWSHLFFSHFSHVVPNLVLGLTCVHFWATFGPPRLHFGIIWVPFLAPKASILVPTAYVLEFLEKQFLEQNTSHTDAQFVTRCRKQTWKPKQTCTHTLLHLRGGLVTSP